MDNWHLPLKGAALVAGPVAADETYLGGKGKKMSNGKHKELNGTGWVTVGKTAVGGLQDGDTNRLAPSRLAALVLKSVKAWV